MAETCREMALREVRKGRKIIAAQRARLEHLRSEGKQTSEAENLLVRYEQSQATFEDDLERLIE
jgi:hypothetical protein